MFSTHARSIFTRFTNRHILYLLIVLIVGHKSVNWIIHEQKDFPFIVESKNRPELGGVAGFIDIYSNDCLVELCDLSVK